MTSIINSLRAKAAARCKRIVLPEASDERVVEAARIMVGASLATPIFVSDAPEIDGIEQFSQQHNFTELRQRALAHFCDKNSLSPVEGEAALENPLNLATSLIAIGYADAGVAGSLATTANVLRAGFKGIGIKEGAKTVSSFFLMELPNGRVLTYADCGVVPDPTAEQLAEIAIDAAHSHQRLTSETARVAMLSFSTAGSAKHPHVDKVIEATELVGQRAPDLLVAGELQFDAAYNPDIGKRKAPDSKVAGAANVFVFPDLDAGNIAYKITQEIGGAKAVGPLLQGLAKPWMDLSRGCQPAEIVDAAAIATLLVEE